MRIAGGDERGSAAAEFAVVLPAIVAVVLLGVGALSAAAAQVRLQDAAADAARVAARGEPDRAGAVVVGQVPGASASVDRDGDLVCITAVASVGVGALAFDLSATGCALDGGL